MRRIFRNLAIAGALSLCGCFSTVDSADRTRFEQITKDLDQGGSCLFVGSSSRAGAALENVIKNTERQIWNSDLPEPVMFNMQHLLSSVELMARAAGFNEIQGWGGSSVKIRRDGIFRNRLKLLLPADSRGALWHIPAKQNIRLGKYLSNLPEDTCFAGVFNLDTNAVSRLLNINERFGSSVDKLCQILLGTETGTLLKSLSGIWKIVIVCDEKYDPELLSGVHIALTVPDADGKVFDLLCKRSKIISGITYDPAAGTIRLSALKGRFLVPFIRKGNGCFTVFSTPDARFRTETLESFPGIKQKQKELLEYTEDSGVAAIYCNAPFSRLYLPGAVTPQENNSSIGFLKRLPEGLLFEEISTDDLNSWAVHALSTLPARMIFEIFREAVQEQKNVRRPPKKSAVTRPAPKAAAVRKQEVQKEDECLKNISLIGSAIRESSVSGKFPPFGIKGLRELAEKKKIDAAKMCCPRIKKGKNSVSVLNYANCHYLYFGEPAGNSAKTPLIMELPFLHQTYIAVYYADGSVKKLPVQGHRNVRRIISILHTMHAYEEQEFFRLMRIAGEFDKILER